jgi:hypothetical protein
MAWQDKETGIQHPKDSGFISHQQELESLTKNMKVIEFSQ